MRRLLLIVLTFFCLFYLSECRVVSANRKLRPENVFNNYNKDVLPPASDAEPLPVNVTVDIKECIKEGFSDLEWILDVTMIWQDQRLISRTKDAAGYPIRFTDTKILWTPDIQLSNARTFQYLSDPVVNIEEGGNVQVFNRLSAVTSCELEDYEYFPFDKILCAIEMISNSYTVNEISASIDSYSKADFGHPPDYELLGVFTDDRECLRQGASYTILTLRAEFERQSSIYVKMWQLPCIMLVTVALLSQFLPAENLVTRGLLSVVSLVTLSAFCLYIKSSMPLLSVASSMDIFIGISLGVVFFNLVQVVAEFSIRKAKNISTSIVSSDSSGESSTSKIQGLIFLSRVVLPVFYLVFVIIFYGVH